MDWVLEQDWHTNANEDWEKFAYRDWEEGLRTEESKKKEAEDRKKFLKEVTEEYPQPEWKELIDKAEEINDELERARRAGIGLPRKWKLRRDHYNIEWDWDPDYFDK